MFVNQVSVRLIAHSTVFLFTVKNFIARMIHTTVISEAFVYSQKQVKNKQRASFASYMLFLTMIDYFINILCLLQIKSEASQISNFGCNFFHLTVKELTPLLLCTLWGNCQQLSHGTNDTCIQLYITLGRVGYIKQN